MNRILNTLALVFITAAAGTGHAATEVASWSFGCSNPSSVGSAGGAAGRAGYDLKKNVKRGEAAAAACDSKDVHSPSDEASRMATGKHFPKAVINTR
jgi:hypothetical protein